MGVIRIGTSSWADRLLIASGWYPRSAATAAGRLAYYAEHFDLVEADTTYYAIPAPETTLAWAERTPAGFTFDVKAFSLFTGHPTRPSMLPKDLRPAGGGREVRRKDLPAETYDELWRRFHLALDPLAAAGKLGAVLLQFPPWFVRSEAARRRIEATVARCRPHRAVVELRHRSWFEPDVVLETLRFLQAIDASYCCVDMPQGHETSVPPLLVSTAAPAYVRFHGHSHAWATGDKQEKFRYAYDEDELAGWAEQLRWLAGETEETCEVHVLLNNCCGDQAQRDAATLAALLDRAAVG